MKKTDNKTNSSLTFKYIFSDDYNPEYASGAFGGITPRGEIVLNFYFERHGIPLSQSYEINPEHHLGKLIETDPKDQQQSYVRFIKNGVILNLQTAIELNHFLTERIEKLKKGDKDI